MENNLVYTVYKVVNLANNKYYIGVHQTVNPNDSYMGSGEGIRLAIKKYGKSNFKKEILFIFDNSDDAFLKESELVTEVEVSDSMCYNRYVGGFGKGVELINRLGINNKGKTEEHFNKWKEGYNKYVSKLKANPKFTNEQLLTSYYNEGSIAKALVALGMRKNNGKYQKILSNLLKANTDYKACKPGPKPKNI